MSLTDRTTIAIELHEDAAKPDASAEVLSALVASIPIAGGAISALLSGRAQRKTMDRAADVFRALKERLEKMDSAKVDRAFFESDEFQTLFTLTLEQVQTTHDRNKLNLLANGLANSAHMDFASESRKELFLRIFRDLAPEHVAMLDKMKPVEGREGFRSSVESPTGDRLAILQHLASQGLVSENLRVGKTPTVNFSHPGSYHVIQKYMETPPTKSFVLSNFGLEFLSFFEAERTKPSGVAFCQ
jgi:hypothetical protein